MKYRTSWRHPGRTAKLLFFTAAATALVVCLIFATVGRVRRAGGQAQINSTVVKERILPINEISSVKYLYTNVGKFSQADQFYGYNIPFTTKSFLITYSGTIKAGVDLQEAQVQVNDRQITLTLPPAKVLSHAIDESSIEVYDESRNLFNPISVKDYTSFAAGEKVKMEKKAAQQGLLKEADEKVRKNLQDLLQTTSGGRKVIFREQQLSSSSQPAQSPSAASNAS